MPAEKYSLHCPIPRSVLRPDLRESSRWNLYNEKQKVLWRKLESSIQDVDRVSTVMGIAIEDLNTGDQYFLHENEVFAQASTIKSRCWPISISRRSQAG